MGLGSGDFGAVVDDGDSGGGADAGSGGKTFGSISCSICLEVVADDGNRSWAKLQCGHQFHLDCIGSAFNVKGSMQCPNCRKIEKGQWLYAHGCRSLPEFSMDDWAREDELIDFSYSELSFGVHWCPYGSLARIPSFYEEGEFAANAYHDLVGQHAVFAEHTAAVTSASHPCPYVAYIRPIDPSSSNSSRNVSDGLNYNDHWNGPNYNDHWNGHNYNDHWNTPSVPSEIPSSYAFPAMDLPYHGWAHHSFSAVGNRMGGADQPISQRPARSSSDLPRPGPLMPPPVIGHGSTVRAGSSVGSSIVLPCQGSNARARGRLEALQAYYQHQPGDSPPLISGNRRSNGRTMASSSGRNFLEAENPPNGFRAWDRDHLHPADREPGQGPVQQAAGGPGPRNLGQRHMPERMPSQHRS